MLPRYHILLGALFTLVIWIFAPELSFIYLTLIFLSTVLIDIDHYAVAVAKTNKWSLNCAFEYHDEQLKIQQEDKRHGFKNRGDFHLFHTIEFHILIGILGAFWLPFLFIFIGMMFHSLLDVFWTLHEGVFYTREYFLFNWFRKQF